MSKANIGIKRCPACGAKAVLRELMENAQYEMDLSHGGSRITCTRCSIERKGKNCIEREAK